MEVGLTPFTLDITHVLSAGAAIVGSLLSFWIGQYRATSRFVIKEREQLIASYSDLVSRTEQINKGLRSDLDKLRAELDDLRFSYERKIERIREEYERKIDHLRAEYQDRINQLIRERDESRRELAELQKLVHSLHVEVVRNHHGGGVGNGNKVP